MISLQHCVILFLCLYAVTASEWNQLKLPKEHLTYYFNNNPQLAEQCRNDSSCPFKDSLDTNKCWGYEDDCPRENRMYSPTCPGEARGWVKGGGKAEQIEMFWKQADFGYIKERQDEMTTICKPKKQGDSSLSCAAFTRYCKAENIYLNFKKLKSQNSKERFRENVFKSGEIGGKCELDTEALKSLGEHKSPLQSWYAELEEYTALDFHPIRAKKCDIVLDKPTVFMKLDAGVNMYHHFCDYVNLYASQHINNSFSKDINVVMWDTSNMNYGDFFHDTWRAFTDSPITHLREYDGKRVCVKDAIFPLLPRMRYGMYYNMPLIPGCESSSLYRGFSQHVLHRLGIRQNGPLKNKLRVTLLERNTAYRKILNQKEIIEELQKNPDYEVTVVDYNYKMPFLEQLEVTHNSDIFMGMHGAGLTHLLFLPDWGTIFEVHNCDDKNCYRDLARLRGVHYMTWEDMSTLEQEDEGHHPTLGAHKKFTNYGFDVKAFAQMVERAAKNVRESSWYQKAWEEKWGEGAEDKEEL